MATKVRIEHNSKGWAAIFKSPEMQSVVDAAGERIAREAGDNFSYMPQRGLNFTAAGTVGPENYEGMLEEAEDKVLTRAVHP